jgi:hypothetical protein
LPAPGVRWYVGTAASSGSLSHLLSVLRDKPVCFAMACNDILSRRYIRLIFPNISMVITFFAPA